MVEGDDASLSRSNGRNVSWPSDDKLCQVRLFAAEDAPSLSGSTLQEFYQAKQTRFLHAAVPISLEDLPPGFEGVAAKSETLDAEAITALVAQIPWCCPGKYELVSSWQVVAGDESMEIIEQGEREVRVLEAIYPRTSAIPPSPTEPGDPQDSNGNTHTLEIPLVPVEDEEECMEAESAMEGTPMINMFNQPSGAALLLKYADLNVAAAAAAAYAAVKATESGRIDQDLLVKILSNPILVETFSLVSEKMRNHSIDPITSSATMNGSVGKPNEPPIAKCQSMLTKTTSLNEGQRLTESKGWLLKGDQGPPGFVDWNVPASIGATITSENPFLASIAHDHATSMGMEHVDVPFCMNSQPINQPPAAKLQLMTPSLAPPSSWPLAPRQEYLKRLIHQHGMTKGDFGHATPLLVDECKPGLIMGRFRPSNVGSSMQDPSGRWLGGDRTHSISFPFRNTREDGIEPVQSKSWKTCIYFNTPRGCRNGINCPFSHESNTEKKLERTRVKIPQPEQVKRPRFELSSVAKN